LRFATAFGDALSLPIPYAHKGSLKAAMPIRPPYFITAQLTL